MAWTRRSFLQASTMASAVAVGGPMFNLMLRRGLTVLATPRSNDKSAQEESTPRQALAAFDHFQLGCADLDAGIAWLERRTNTRAVVGGVHPGNGTRNALASLGPRHYLEVYAPDPQQANVDNATVRRLRGLTSPTIIGWAIGTKDLDGLKRDADAAGVKATVTPGSRQRPDGKLLRWRVLNLVAPPQLAPFFIEWSAKSVHPSSDAPHAGTVERLVFETPEPDELRKTLQTFAIAADIREGPVARIRLTVATRTGRVEIG
jgi:hypothetical protein